MIAEIFEDKGTILKDGEEIPYVNHAHRYWLRMENGSTRPATDTELELWEKLQEALAQNHLDDSQIAELQSEVSSLRNTE